MPVAAIEHKVSYLQEAQTYIHMQFLLEIFEKLST